jgi:sulfide:quinone oxidoreductase
MAARQFRTTLRVMQRPLHVLIAGAGVAALEATLALKALAEERVDVEVLAPETDFVYRPLAVAEPFGKGEVRSFPVRRLIELAGARLTAGALASVDLAGRRVHTADGRELPWEVLVLAVGVQTREGVPGGLTFRGREQREELTEVLEAVSAGLLASITFALPTQTAWPLPLYELALMTKTVLEDRGATQVHVRLVTPEASPLAVFGTTASETVAEVLAGCNIAVQTHTTPVVFRDGALVVVPGQAIRTQQVVSIPVPEGRQLPGIRQDGRGFVPVDERGRVEGRDDVYAVGDMTAFPIKQGGIAAQQADAAAEWIAALAGAEIEPRPFRPVLRGLLLTGLSPRFLRADVLDGSSEVDMEPLWWPPGKIAGRYLAPFLAEHLGLSTEPPPGLLDESGTREVEVELEVPGGAHDAR